MFNIIFSKLVMAYGMITHSGPNKTQCISMDLNKKSGTEPKTTAGSRRTPLGFKITMLIGIQNNHAEFRVVRVAVTKFSKVVLR